MNISIAKSNTPRNDSKNIHPKGAFFPEGLRKAMSDDLHLTETAEANAREVIEDVFGELPGKQNYSQQDDTGDDESAGPVLKKQPRD